QLMQKGADPNLWTAGSRFGNALQLVAFYGKIDLLKFLLTKGIHDTPGGDYGTALCAACANGKVEVLSTLLGAGARRNLGE
ncbi:hypothetical protein B0H13DRAFT_1627438, partial [Mycena leptocephala]